MGSVAVRLVAGQVGWSGVGWGRGEGLMEGSVGMVVMVGEALHIHSFFLPSLSPSLLPSLSLPPSPSPSSLPPSRTCMWCFALSLSRGKGHQWRSGATRSIAVSLNTVQACSILQIKKQRNAEALAESQRRRRREAPQTPGGARGTKSLLNS